MRKKQAGIPYRRTGKRRSMYCVEYTSAIALSSLFSYNHPNPYIYDFSEARVGSDEESWRTNYDTAGTGNVYNDDNELIGKEYNRRFDERLKDPKASGRQPQRREPSSGGLIFTIITGTNEIPTSLETLMQIRTIIGLAVGAVVGGFFAFISWTEWTKSRPPLSRR